MPFASPRNAPLMVVVCSLSTAAVAQPDPKAEARTHFEHGFELAKDGAYAEAVAEFNRAYQQSPNYAVLFNLGQAYIGMGQPVYAVEALSRYLSEGGKEVLPARRKQVEADIAQQERRIATVTIHSPIPGAVIRVDGVEVGKSPILDPVRLGAGSHLLAAVLPGYRPWEQRLELAGKEHRFVTVELEPLASPAPAMPPSGAPAVTSAPPSTAPAAANPPAAPAAAAGLAAQPATDMTAKPSPVQAGTGSGRIAAYVVGGLGLGSLVVGSVFGIRAITKENDSNGECPNDRCSQRGVDLNNQAKTSALVADLTIGAGLAGIGVATYLFLRSPKVTGATPGTAASGIRVAPAVGPSLAGVTLESSW